MDAFRVAALLIVFGRQILTGTILPHLVVSVFAEYQVRGERREEAVTALVADPARHARLGAEARAYAHEILAADRVLVSLERLVEQMAARPRFDQGEVGT